MIRMTTALDALREANQAVLAQLAERERELSTRERALTDELTAIENARRALSADRETLQKAQAIQTRMLSGVQIMPPVLTVMAAETKPDGGQMRARIGPQRYAMLAALRDNGPLTIEQIAAETGLSTARIREQMRADHPIYVCAGPVAASDPALQGLVLTVAGMSLLVRFENYRRAQGKPLPTLGDPDDSNDDDAKGDADAGDAEAQKDEAAGTVPSKDAPTASNAETKAENGDGLFTNPSARP